MLKLKSNEHKIENMTIKMDIEDDSHGPLRPHKSRSKLKNSTHLPDSILFNKKI